METIHFTDRNMAILSTGKTMTQDIFFKTLEDNIESDKYNVNYNSEKQKFLIRYNGIDYQVFLNGREEEEFKKGNTSLLIRKLLSLSQVQTLVDVQHAKEKNIILDHDAKVVYHKKIKKSFNVINYLKDYMKDIKVSGSDTKKFLSKYIYPFKSNGWDWSLEYFSALFITLLSMGVVICFFNIFPAIVLNNSIIMIVGFLLPQLLWTAFPITYTIAHIKNRIKRLIEYSSNNKNVNTVMKNLEKSIGNEQKILNQQVKEGKKLEEKLIEKENMQYDFTKLIDGFINSLSQINPLERQDIKKEIQEVLIIYKNNSQDNHELENKIMALQLKINDAIKRNQANTRLDEIDYLEERLENNDQGYSYKKVK